MILYYLGDYVTKLYGYYLESCALDEEKDKEFFDGFADLWRTDEVQGLKKYPQHSDIDRLRHILSVTYMSYRMALDSGADTLQTVRGAILHDLFYYDWHDGDWSHRPHGYRHPGFALKNARELTELTEIEENIIYRHMFPLTPVPPKYREGLIVSFADKYCATLELMIAGNGKFREKFESDLEKIK